MGPRVCVTWVGKEMTAQSREPQAWNAAIIAQATACAQITPVCVILDGKTWIALLRIRRFFVRRTVHQGLVYG